MSEVDKRESRKKKINASVQLGLYNVREKNAVEEDRKKAEDGRWTDRCSRSRSVR